VSRITYLDHAATTPLREEVRDAMLPHLSGLSGNPSSIHAPGRHASAALREARERVASALGAQPEEIVFTRGGTESDNLAVLGRAAVARREGRPPVVAHSAIEHSAVLEACRQVEDDGGIRLRLPVTSDGSLDDGALDAAIAHAPDVLSVMWVNNETGTILPVPAVARRASSEGVVLHSDAVQAIGKVPVDVDRVPVSLLTITGHKIGGPRGTGVLFVRRGTELRPVFHGGGQERGLRPGTEDLAGAVGMAEAVSLAVEEQAAEAERLGALRERLEARLRDALPGLRVYGADAPRAPHVLAVGLADDLGRPVVAVVAPQAPGLRLQFVNLLLVEEPVDGEEAVPFEGLELVLRQRAVHLARLGVDHRIQALGDPRFRFDSRGIEVGHHIHAHLLRLIGGFSRSPFHS